MWVVIAIAVLVALVVLLLCVPLSIALSIYVYGDLKFRLRLGWLFGLVAKDIKRKKKATERRESGIEGRPKSRRKRVSIALVVELLRTRGLLRRVWKLVVDILRLVKIRDFRADIKVGLDDPADTGFLFASIGSPLLFLNPAITNRINIRPSFSESATFEGYLHASVKFLPVQVILPGIGFVFSLPILRVIWTLIKSKWKRKK